jgi:hypothetical protein
MRSILCSDSTTHVFRQLCILSMRSLGSVVQNSPAPTCAAFRTLWLVRGLLVATTPSTKLSISVSVMARERIAGRNYPEYEACDLSFVASWNETAARVAPWTHSRSTSRCRSSPRLLSNTPLRSDATSQLHRLPPQGIGTPHRIKSSAASKLPLCPPMLSSELPILWASTKWIFWFERCRITRLTQPHALDVTKPDTP